MIGNLKTSIMLVEKSQSVQKCNFSVYNPHLIDFKHKLHGLFCLEKLRAENKSKCSPKMRNKSQFMDLREIHPNTDDVTADSKIREKQSCRFYQRRQKLVRRRTSVWTKAFHSIYMLICELSFRSLQTKILADF